ncbi:MAG: serine/threonine protein kinase, partial [Eubacteriaceae bacterium]|nr:serine/threonine protein kinase [Eubacteriaceae bacterium]
MKKSKQVSLDKREVELLVARVFNHRYLVRGHLGSGGMGSVFEIESNNEFHLRYALKIVDLSSYPDNMDPGAEIHAMKSISSHEGFPKVYEIERDENYLYSVQEFISGKTLKEIFVDNGAIDDDILVVWMTEAAKALAYLHHRGMIHRDIKPSNIMITNDGHVKIIDLGLVRRVGFVDVADEQLIASRIYTPPERFERVPADERTDIYAFGATFYQLATGEPPLDMSSDSKNQMKKMQEHLMRVSSKGLRSIIKQCLQPKPDRRPQNFDSILTQLQHLELLDQEVAYLEDKRRKRKMIMIGCLIGGFLLIVIGCAVRIHARNAAFNEYMRQGTDYLSNNELDDAEEAFHLAIAMKGDNIAAHQGYNEVLTAEEQYDKVISDIEALFGSNAKAKESGGL